MSHSDHFKLQYQEIHDKAIVNHVAHIEENPNVPYDLTTLVNLYTIVFKLCKESSGLNHDQDMDDSDITKDSHTTMLFRKLIDELKTTLQTYYFPKLDCLKESDDDTFLREWRQRWMNFRRFTIGLRIIYFYLDTIANDRLTIFELAYSLYYTEIFEPFRERLFTAFRNSVVKHRAGGAVDAPLLSSVTQSLVTLGSELRENKGEAQLALTIYRSLAELLIADMEAYYGTTVGKWLEEGQYGEFVNRVDQVFKTELEGRVNAYLHKDTYEPIRTKLHKISLKDHLQRLLGMSGAMEFFFAPSNGTQLALLYFLCASDSESVKIVADCLNTHLKALGIAIVRKHIKLDKEDQAAAAAPAAGAAPAASPARRQPLVEELVQLNHQYEDTIKQQCQGSPVLCKTLNSAFQSFINEEKHVSEQLALYAHSCLSARSAGTVGSAGLDRLEDVASLYDYIREKDVFQKRYHGLLAQRLLDQNSAGVDAERVMMTRLVAKGAAGSWADNLKSMLDDVIASADFSARFSQAKADTLREHGLGMTVTVCTNQMWPDVVALTDVSVLPPALRDMATNAAAHYRNISEMNAQKTVEWHLERGTAEVAVEFVAGRKILVVTTLMVAVLHALDTLENAKFITWAELQTRLHITPGSPPARVLQAHVLSLTNPKYGVVQKSNPKDPRSLADNEKLMIAKNMAPAHKHTAKVFIPLHMERTEEEISKQQHAISANRTTMLQAAVVRIMKARKQMSNKELQAEVMSQMQSFSPNTVDYKVALEKVIADEYIRRDEDDRTQYHYMA